MQLSDFILQRISEDEAVANIAGAGEWASWNRSWDMDPVRDLAIAGQRVAALPMSIDEHVCRHDPARVLAECEAKRRIVELHSRVSLPAWEPDCGGDWCLAGGETEGPGWGFFANYWPDNTVSASVFYDGEKIKGSGIVAHQSKADCQSFAEHWVRDNLPSASPTLRALALPYTSHADYQEEWRL